MFMLLRFFRIIVTFLFIFACGASFFMFKSPAHVSPETGLDMVQPGANAKTSYTNSLVNVNNSQANLNNSEARLNDAKAVAVITDAEGNLEVNKAQAEKLRAEACDIRNDCHPPAGTIPAKPGDLLIFAIVVFCIGFVAFALIKAAFQRGK